jgi:hypothetical protein
MQAQSRVAPLSSTTPCHLTGNAKKIADREHKSMERDEELALFFYTL